MATFKRPRIFLSHIHEESRLAVIVQQALVAEFGGLVDVFVASDDRSIPAGSDYMKGIEDALMDCVAAIYLISPQSVKRNWINFELGAVWIRRLQNIRGGLPLLPTLPLCHSGMTPSTLPPPLNFMNAVIAGEASKLEFAFTSVQAAVGAASVPLRTDFKELSAAVVAFENDYTFGTHLAQLLGFVNDLKGLITECKKDPSAKIQVQLLHVPLSKVQIMQEIVAQLKGRVQIVSDLPRFAITEHAGGDNICEMVRINIPAEIILQNLGPLERC